MPANIEVKARVPCRETLLVNIAKLVPAQPKMIQQCDTFYECEDGRLKLREFSVNQENPDSPAELIWYKREDTTDTKISNFTKTLIENVTECKQQLAEKHGIRGQVKKTRLLFYHQETHTRIHVDDVEGLGSYVELEVAQQDGQTVQECDDIAKMFCSKLDIKKEDEISVAYIDLLLAKDSDL